MREKIEIHIKLFTGLHREAAVNDYDIERGFKLEVPKGTTIKKVAKMLKLPEHHSLAYFVNGQQVDLWKKLEEESEIACMKPSAGG